MDENVLNELLECSVCLERLDTTSRVLPCQHTFCRACLEIIVSAHKELRCPECRVLVSTKIDDLPPNVLLMRILEGLKNSCTVKNEEQHDVRNYEQHTQQQTQAQLQATYQQQPATPQTQAFNSQRRCLLPHAYALYDFNSTEPTDLHFKKGDLIILKQKIDSNWFVGQLNGVEGTFPSNYVQVILPLPVTPQAVALYDFRMQPNEEEGCLNFKKGALVHVLRRVDQNWAEGRIGNTIGIFPIAFVEFNAIAKKMLARIEPKDAISQQQQNLSQQPVINPGAIVRHLPPIPLLDPTTNNSDTTTSPSSVSTPSSASSSNTSNTAATSPSASEVCNAANIKSSNASNLSINSNSLPNTPQHYVNGGGECGGSVRYRNGREKRHSLNALLLNGASNVTHGLSILQTNRHSAEILSIPSEELIVGTKESQSSAAAHERRQSGTLQATLTTQPQQTTTTRANVLKTACGPSIVPTTLPWGYLALYPYKPRKSDELELKKGCVYIVTERCLDGWFKGKNWQDISGVFPGNYVTPLRARDQQQLMHQWKFVPTTATTTQNLPMSAMKNSSPTANNGTSQEQMKTHGPKPPELPPRNAVTTTTCASVWTKPLSHTVEAFFNRSNSTAKNDEKSKEKETKTKDSTSSGGGAVGLMKRLSHIKSRTKSPGHVTASATATTAAAAEVENTANIHANPSSENPLQSAVNLQPVHMRSGSCPSQLLQNMPPNAIYISNKQQQQKQYNTNFMNHGSERNKGPKERLHLEIAPSNRVYEIINAAPAPTINNSQSNTKCAQQFQQQQPFSTNLPPLNAYHRKSHSLDANNMLTGGVPNLLKHAMPASLSPATTQNATSMNAPQMSMPNYNVTAAAIAQSATTKSTHCGRESRFRCIVPYPPNSEIELELHVGDIIFVQRKQKNGWYKGTHAVTQKTGLFPASFVEPDL